MLTKIAIREFHIEDYDALIKLWDDAKLPYRPKGRDKRDKIENELRQGNSIFLIAETTDRIVGSIFGTHDGRKGWINRLAVAPDFRKQGIARMLTVKVEEHFSELGIEIVACLIEDWNTESMQTFERLGYKQHSDVFYFSKRKNLDV